MPPQLLPASAAAFAPRASIVNVVLGSEVEPWVTQTLKRVNRARRPLNNVNQHRRCMEDLLSSPDAIWNLASILIPTTPETVTCASEGHTSPQPSLASPMPDVPPSLDNLCFQMLHIQAYIVHVDMILRHEVVFKLTTDTIDALVRYHKDIYCVDTRATVPDWPDKDKGCKKLHDDFVQAINKFVYHAPATALEGLEEEGAGELLRGKSQEVKQAILSLLKPLVPPSPQPSMPPPPLLRHQVQHRQHQHQQHILQQRVPALASSIPGTELSMQQMHPPSHYSQQHFHQQQQDQRHQRQFQYQQPQLQRLPLSQQPQQHQPQPTLHAASSQAPVLSNSPANPLLWSPTIVAMPPSPADPWGMLPSSPAMASACTDTSSLPIWPTTMGMISAQPVSPLEAFSTSMTTTSTDPMLAVPQLPAPMVSFALPIPMPYATGHCGMGMDMGPNMDMGLGMMGPGFPGLGWDQYPELASAM